MIDCDHWCIGWPLVWYPEVLGLNPTKPQQILCLWLTWLIGGCHMALFDWSMSPWPYSCPPIQTCDVFVMCQMYMMPCAIHPVMPCGTPFYPFFLVGKKLQIIISSSYDVRLSTFKLYCKVLIELYAMTSFFINIWDYKILSIPRSNWITQKVKGDQFKFRKLHVL